jgi:hypothetical protein
LHGERRDYTLQPTALVSEAFGRLLEEETLADAPDRAYPFAAAAKAMHLVLIEHARRRKARKRGSKPSNLMLDDRPGVCELKGINCYGSVCIRRDGRQLLSCCRAVSATATSIRRFWPGDPPR